MAISNNNDPTTWTTLNKGDPILTTSLGMGGIRDPSLIIAPDRSKFWLLATDLKVWGRGWNNGTCYTCNGSKSIHVWESNDLARWTGPMFKTVAPPEAAMAWAPDAIWDPVKNKFLVYFTSKLDSQLVLMKAHTEDFKTFTRAEEFNRLGMDATIALEGETGKYYWFSKHGPDELIQQNVAGSPEGPWKTVSERIGADGGMPAGEGPLVFRDNRDPKKWHLWIDDYMRGDGGYLPFTTNDISKGKWTVVKNAKLPKNPRHGYVTPITAAERARLVAAYGV